MSFADCPRLLVPADGVDAFWRNYSLNPRPLILLTPDYDRAFDFAADRAATLHDDGTYVFAKDRIFIGPNRPYLLTSPAHNPEFFSGDNGVTAAYPLPPALSSIDLRPVISIGLNGTGERDLARHYHPITAMRLLQGRKVWAIRAPGDEECMFLRGSCTDPFDVCAYYSQASSPQPSCVQEAGETILVPHGFYHGTCNMAAITVGVGGQGQRMAYDPPACFHCRNAPGQQLHYATTREAIVTLADEAALLEGARQQRRGDINFLHLGPASQSPYQAFRSTIHQFLRLSHAQYETLSRTHALISPECVLRSPSELISAGEEWHGRREEGAQAAAFVLVPFHGRATAAGGQDKARYTLTFRHPGSAERERRSLPARHAAFFVGERTLARVERATAEDYNDDLFVACKVLMPPIEAVFERV